MATNKKIESPKISVNVIARNEEKKIADCLISARLLADEIVLIDMESTDKTVKIGRKYADKIYSHPQVGYVEPARKFGITKCRGDWVFILDADERITPILASEIKEKIKKNADSNIGAFAVPRANYNFGVWLKHGGWWPDYQVRLIRKSNFIDWPKKIHSFPKIKGEIVNLREPFNHFAIDSIEQMMERTVRYSQKEVELLKRAGVKSNLLVMIRKMLGEFYRRGIKMRGFLDGVPGAIQVIYQTYSVFITYARLWEYQHQNEK